MKAMVYTEYGPPEVLQIQEIPQPVPAPDEVLIKIRAVSINGSDREALIGKPFYARIGGFRSPGESILGSDIAGRVERVGKNHAEFQVGDEVFGELPGYHGGFAEYACTHGRTLARRPASLTPLQAAAIPQAGVIAWNGIIKQGRVQPGQRVLINGAGGSGGSFAIQLAKMQGAEVTGVDNTHKLDFMRSLGADHVIDHTKQTFTENRERYDLILDLIAHRSIFAIARSLKRGGTYYFVGGSTAVIFQILLLGPFVRGATGRNVRMLIVPQNRTDLLAIADLCETGKIVPAIDRQFPFNETPAAMRYISEGYSKGKVVINMEEL
jgi:NADPH:quinone reductase-like Zn-dependent oxidoreductase